MTTAGADPHFWDALAEQYAAKPVENPDAFEAKKRVTKALLTPTSRVFEFGCGTGTLAIELAPLVADVTAIDLSPAMIEIAKRKAKAAGVENTRFLVSKAGDLANFEPGSFQMVCAYSILHLVPDPQAALRDAFDLLAPGGHLVSSTVCLGESWMPYAAILAVMGWVGKAPYVRIVTRDEVMDWLREAGFVNVREEEVGAGPNTGFIVAKRPG